MKRGTAASPCPVQFSFEYGEDRERLLAGCEMCLECFEQTEPPNHLHYYWWHWCSSSHFGGQWDKVQGQDPETDRVAFRKHTSLMTDPGLPTPLQRRSSVSISWDYWEKTTQRRSCSWPFAVAIHLQQKPLWSSCGGRQQPWRGLLPQTRLAQLNFSVWCRL